MENGQRIFSDLHGKNAFSHIPEHGFSLFLKHRTKTIHFIRHAEGTHNEANRNFGNDTPVEYSTQGAWKYQDASLTNVGIQQCIAARVNLLHDVEPELIVVSPFKRTLQTSHIMFGGKGVPFMVHDLCRERSGRYTCDKRSKKTEIISIIKPLFENTNDVIDFSSFGFQTEEDENWTNEREPSEMVINRGIKFLEWLATRPEMEIAVVTHSSFLKHLFQHFGDHVVEKDQAVLHRLAGNAEVRSICLALHKGFYPEGHWDGDTFIPDHPSFRKGRWAPSIDAIASMHKLPLT